MEDSQLKLESKGGWIAMIQHYFLSAWIPDQEETNLVYSIANTKRNPGHLHHWPALRQQTSSAQWQR